MSAFHRQKLVIGLSLIVVGVVIGCLLWTWWMQRTPIVVAKTFMDVISHQDWTSLVRFIHPTERQTLGLTPEKVKFIGERLIAPTQQMLGNKLELKKIGNPFADTPEEEIYFRDSHFFRLIREGKEGAVVIVVQTEEGWRVNFSMFVYTLLMEAAERGKLSHDWAIAYLRQVGISRLFIGKESVPLQ